MPPVNDLPAGMSARGAARRRFAKAGAGVSAGVLATLSSKSAMAMGPCLTASAAASGNQSRVSPDVGCAGLSPGFWKTHHDEWRGAGTNGDSKFSLTFPLTSRCAALSAYTCFDVVDPLKVVNGSDPNNVAMHIMATLLNVRSQRITFLTEKQVLAIWNSYAHDGSYRPIPGTVWYGADIVVYLQSTMT